MEMCMVSHSQYTTATPVGGRLYCEVADLSTLTIW